VVVGRAAAVSSKQEMRSFVDEIAKGGFMG
jgi:hypothetical protein